MSNSYQILIDKLIKFQKKYYLFKVLRGLLISIILLILIYLSVSIIEYFSYFSTNIRKIIFFGFLIFTFLIISHFILIPFIYLLFTKRNLNHIKINKIISEHFPEIKDKLLNTIELYYNKQSHFSNELIWASIDQKINEIKFINFQKAISYKNLKFITSYFFISLVIVFTLLIFQNPVIKESNYRLINYQEEFIKPSPYEFILINNNLDVYKGDKYNIQVKCTGDYLPDLVYINIEGYNYLMKKNEENIFEYNIESVLNSFQFNFTDNTYHSQSYILNVIPKPNISNFSINIISPEHTGLREEKLQNIGDIIIKEGSLVEWTFDCIDTDSLLLIFNNNRLVALKENNLFKINSKFYENSIYTVSLLGKYINQEDIVTYSINVEKDLYPLIDVVQAKDSSYYSRYYFKGTISDDYGFSSLNFHFNIENNDSIIPLNIIRNLKDQEFYYSFDFNDFKSTNPITYYFSVSDNDEINNYKTTTSDSYIFNFPSNDEILAYENEEFEDVENMILRSQELTQEIKEDLYELQLKNINSNNSQWEKSQLINNIIDKKTQLENILNTVQNKNGELNNYLNSFTEQSEEILKKQDQLGELLDEVLSDEIKELFEEFNKLAEEFDNDKFNQLSRQMDMSFEDLSKQLDRNLEMLKRFKVENKLANIINELYDISQNEEKLSININENREFENVLNENNNDEKNFDQQYENLDDALELNNELKNPLNFDDFDLEYDLIKEEFQNNKNELENRNRRKSSNSLKNTSEQIKNLAFNMDQMLQTYTMEQNMENIENLRQILSNLIYMSFTQEDILFEAANTNINDPRLNKLKQDQKRLKDQSLIVKDSLYALADRTPQINNMISNELYTMELNLDNSVNELENENIQPALASQQYVITSTNNLALLLNEALDQIEEQIANSMSGDQQCENPNGQNGNQMNLLKQTSQNIKEQLQKMIEEMKNGNSQQMSKMLSQALMQHEMMQQMIREIINTGTIGNSTKEQLQQIDDMLEQARKDIMNKNIGTETLFRQNQIISHLLEAENAELERDIDNKRESNTADEDFYSNPVKYFEYNINSEYGLEKLQQSDYQLNNFYNNKYKQYIQNIELQNANQ